PLRVTRPREPPPRGEPRRRGEGVSTAALVLLERSIERNPVGHRRPALALDGERARTRRRSRREPGIAGALVLDAKRRGEHVAGARRVRLHRGPRPHLVAVAVDEEQRAVAIGGKDTDRDVLEPFDHGGLLAADVLTREEERLDLVQQGAQRLPRARADGAVPADQAEPALRRGRSEERRVGKGG